VNSLAYCGFAAAAAGGASGNVVNAATIASMLQNPYTFSFASSAGPTVADVAASYGMTQSAGSAYAHAAGEYGKSKFSN
jgi:hypothetical protein